ncbi:hypothetical protein [Niallia sp. 03133]|uniref:hypothetical protein n=1 Tax=Niallia sp. 03133 TaxID=3458060 RepID=UPI0040442D6D
MGSWHSKLSKLIQWAIIFLCVFFLMFASYYFLVYTNKEEKVSSEKQAEITKGTEEQNEITVHKGTIESIMDNAIIISGMKYLYTSTVQAVLNTKNEEALKHAEIQFNVKDDNTIIQINRLQLQASGKPSSDKTDNIVMSGSSEAFSGDLIVQADYITIKDIKIDGNLTITEENSHQVMCDNVLVNGQTIIAGKGQAVLNNVQLNHLSSETNTAVDGESSVGTLTVNKEAAVIVGEEASVQLYVPAVNNTTLSLYGEVETLKADTVFLMTGSGRIKELILQKDSSLTSDFSGKITNLLLPDDEKPEVYIKDYDKLAGSIDKVNGKLVENHPSVSDTYERNNTKTPKAPEHFSIKIPDITIPKTP